MRPPQSVNAANLPCAVSGPGACCAEAQADGVPCAEIRDCATCGRAVRAERTGDPVRPA